MQTAAFTLEHLFYPETTVKANFDFQRGYDAPFSEPEVTVTIPQQVGGSEQPVLQVMLTIFVRVASPADAYEIATVTVGRFISNGTLTTQEFVQQVILSAPNILYSSTREHILGITSRSAWGEFTLPAIVFGPEDFRRPDNDND